MTHAIAALEGTRGRVRAATSAHASWPRACASRRRSGPPATGGRPGTPTRARRASCTRRAGSRSIARCDSEQHITVDPKVARALYYAWRARDQLQLPAATVARIVALRARRSPTRPSSAIPNIRLNQINFAAELHACAASMTGRHDAAAQRLPPPARALPGRRQAVGAAVADPEPRPELQLPPQPVPARRARTRTSSRPSTPTSCSTSSTTTSRRGATG